MYVRIDDLQIEGGGEPCYGNIEDEEFEVTTDNSIYWPVDVKTGDVHMAFSMKEAESLARRILEAIENDARTTVGK